MVLKLIKYCFVFDLFFLSRIKFSLYFNYIFEKH